MNTQDTGKRYSIKTLCANLGWTKYDLARNAEINYETVNRAWRGKAVRAPTAKKLADTFSKAYEETIRVTDIYDLHVIGLEDEP